MCIDGKKIIHTCHISSHVCTNNRFLHNAAYISIVWEELTYHPWVWMQHANLQLEVIPLPYLIRRWVSFGAQVLIPSQKNTVRKFFVFLLFLSFFTRAGVYFFQYFAFRDFTCLSLLIQSLTLLLVMRRLFRKNVGGIKAHRISRWRHSPLAPPVAHDSPTQ